MFGKVYFKHELGSKRAYFAHKASISSPPQNKNSQNFMFPSPLEPLFDSAKNFVYQCFRKVKLVNIFHKGSEKNYFTKKIKILKIG